MAAQELKNISDLIKNEALLLKQVKSAKNIQKMFRGKKGRIEAANERERQRQEDERIFRQAQEEYPNRMIAEIEAQERIAANERARQDARFNRQLIRAQELAQTQAQSQVEQQSQMQQVRQTQQLARDVHRW